MSQTDPNPLYPTSGDILLSLARAILAKCGPPAEPLYKLNTGDRLAKLLTRSATSTMTITDAEAFGNIAVKLVAALTPASAAAAVLRRALEIVFGRAAEVHIPGISMAPAAWVGEAGVIPVVQGATTPGALLELFKLAVILVVTDELARSSNAEAVLKQMIVESFGPTLDAALFSASPGVSGIQPPGILSGLAPLPASTATSPAEALADDLGALAGALAPVSGSGTPVLIVNPVQAAALVLLAPRDVWPVLVSPAVPVGDAIALVPEALAASIDVPRIEPSRHSTLHMNTTPLDIGSAGGVAAPTISVYQTDTTANRVILPVSWALRSTAGVAWISDTSWRAR